MSRGWLQGIGFALFATALLGCHAARAEHPPFPAGLPPQHVTLPDASFEFRFHSVAQSPDGVLFVGGRDGVYSYDGRRWQTSLTPNGHIVRSLLHDGAERLYVGGYGMFGYLEFDATGLPLMVDLTPDLDSLVDAANFADIWGLLLTPEAVYFRALFHLFRYDLASGEVTSWHHDGRFGAMAWHDGQVLAQFRGIGIKQWQSGDWELTPGGEVLTEHVLALLPLPEGDLLTLGRDGQWRRFGQGQIAPWTAPPGLPGPEMFDAWLVLPDGSFALGGSDGHIYLVDPSAGTATSFRLADGFISDLAPASGGGFLAQTDLATHHVFWPSQWTRLAAESGLSGRVEKIVPWQDGWWVLSNSGVFEIGPGDSQFRRLEWSAFETWDWLALDDDRALLAESFHVREIRGDSSPRTVTDAIYPRLLKPSAWLDDVILVGTELGLAVLDPNGNGEWNQAFVQQNFTGRVLSIIELEARELLLAIADTGIVRATLSQELDALTAWQVLDSEHGIEYKHRRELYLTDLEGPGIVASTSAGFFRWQGDHFEATPLFGLDLRVQRDQAWQLTATADGTWWAWIDRELWRRPVDGIWQQEDLAALRPAVLSSLAHFPGHPVMIGDHAAILMFDPSRPALQNEEADVALRTVELVDADGQVSRLPLDGRPIILPHDIRSMVFEYALPSFRRPEQRRYRARMLGYEDDFGDWRETTRITYTVFSPGPKRFEVMGRDAQGRVSHSRPFEFEILPPWYRTSWAMLLWLLLAVTALVVLVTGVVRWRVARVDTERQRLANKVHERTRELAAANRKLRNMANVDGLTGVANRRRLDEFLDEVWQRCLDRASDMAVILIDVDHFKAFNDDHGHQAGDRVLKGVADLLATSLRRNEDVAARYGGEEFMVVMPSASTDQAVAVAEQMRQRIAGSALGVTISAGVASLRPSSEHHLGELIKAADLALYQAKKQGRNRVCTAT